LICLLFLRNSEILYDKGHKGKGCRLDVRVPVDIPDANCPDSSFIAPYIGLSGSNTYTFETTGYLDPEETGYGIRAVVKVVGAGGFNYLYYKSPADIRHDRNDKS
jgi:hypothetical protein